MTKLGRTDQRQNFTVSWFHCPNQIARGDPPVVPHWPRDRSCARQLPDSRRPLRLLETFRASLVRSRLNTAAALSAARVLPALILGGIAYRYLPQLLAMASDLEAQVLRNWQYRPGRPRMPRPHPSTVLGYPFGWRSIRRATAPPREAQASASSATRSGPSYSATRSTASACA